MWISDGFWAAGVQFRILPLLPTTVYIFCPNSTPVGHFIICLNSWDLNLVFMGMWAMPNMSSGFRHIFGCIYIYMYMCVVQLTFVMQVAACLFLCSFVLVLFRILVENEFNLISPTPST